MNALLDAIANMPATKEAQRLFHGRGGCFPGCEHLSLDIFPPALLLTSFAPLDGSDLQTIGAALQARWQQLHPGTPLTWVYQCRALGAAETRLMEGTLPEPHTVPNTWCTRYAAKTTVCFWTWPKAAVGFVSTLRASPIPSAARC